MEPYVHPGIDIQGIGIIALPLLPVQAKDIVSKCSLAPFGRGEATLSKAIVYSIYTILLLSKNI